VKRATDRSKDLLSDILYIPTVAERIEDLLEEILKTKSTRKKKK
jgi:uncharacterized small protein (DUF1192 family)